MLVTIESDEQRVVGRLEEIWIENGFIEHFEGFVIFLESFY